jgi:hypothetical protein
LNESAPEPILLRTRHRRPAGFTPLGERRLKGFAESVPVYRLEWRSLASTA